MELAKTRSVFTIVSLVAALLLLIAFTAFAANNGGTSTPFFGMSSGSAGMGPGSMGGMMNSSPGQMSGNPAPIPQSTDRQQGSGEFQGHEQCEKIMGQNHDQMHQQMHQQTRIGTEEL